MKRLIFCILLLKTLVGHAGDTFVVDGVVYTRPSNGHTCIASGWDEETPIQSLHIIGEVEGWKVEGIQARAFEDNTNIEYVTIDEGVTYIGQNAFNRCTGLKSVVMPEGLKLIEEEAFAYCTGLTTVVIPSTVTDIRSHAFMHCEGVTDVYYLTQSIDQLTEEFSWWDGIYRDSPSIAGGMEFNTNANTVIHVPAGWLKAYIDSHKFDAWLDAMHEDDGIYPLWWIVNYGVVGRDYTVGDVITGIYVDALGDGLYAKDDGKWLTPDMTYRHEIDYMKDNQLPWRYDQSNWVVLRNVQSPRSFIDHIIADSTVTGTLQDKKNPEILVKSSPQPGRQVAKYTPNTYTPCSFMQRTQQGVNGKTYAFVRPKPQEYIHVMWSIYHGDNDAVNQFYIPAHDREGMNSQEFAGGFDANFELYESPTVPELMEGGVYEFKAINRQKTNQDVGNNAPMPGLLQNKIAPFEPYTEPGVSNWFVACPLEVPDQPIITGIADRTADPAQDKERWFTIDGRHLGTRTPTAPGLYIHGNRIQAICHPTPPCD